MTRADEGKAAAVAFYASVLDEAELRAAMRVEGVDGELAALRLQLRRLLEARPEDHALMLKSVREIARTATERYRMSPKSKKELADSLADVIERIGEQLLPPGESS